MKSLSVPDFHKSDEPLAQQVMQRLRHAIITLQIRPGERLSEQEVATRFGISRQPVREAFIKLGEAGLVRIRPKSGTRVIKISLGAVENARFIREAVECAIVRDAAIKSSTVGLGRIAHCIDQQRDAIARHDGAELFQLDEEFHRLLADGAGRLASWALVEDLKSQMNRVRYLDMARAIPMQTVFSQHIEIANAVKSRDADGAEQAMRRHLGEILVSLPKLAQTYPDLFETGPED